MRLETHTKRRDGGIQPQAKCPKCGEWADVDEDQLRGEISMVCDNCSWHGNVDGSTA